MNRKHITKLSSAELGYPTCKVESVFRIDDFTAEYTLRTPDGDHVDLEVSDVGGSYTVRVP